MPRLTVLMSVKNGEPYLRTTVESILNQTYGDFEFLILDNASKDNSREIIRSFSDPRIRLIEFPRDLGQVGALNKGLDMIETRLVARMDADDISMPRRFEYQVAFMEKHPEVGICGTYGTAVEGEQKTRMIYPLTAEGIRVQQLFECALAHPSVMMRKELLDKFGLRYDEEIGFSEDWELWHRAEKCFPLANIPKYLLKYRIHSESVSLKNPKPRQEVDGRLLDRKLEELNLHTHPLKQIHRDTALATTYNSRGRDIEFVHNVIEWFDLLETANDTYRIYDKKLLRRFLLKRLFRILRVNAHLRSKVLDIFSEKKLFLYISPKASLKFLLNVLFSANGNG
jgi:glycosyltransferase involved in cell wall biosynthesis